MKKRLVLLALIIGLSAAALCLFAGCGASGGSGSNDGVKYLHFVDKDQPWQTLLDIRLGNHTMNDKDADGDYIKTDMFGVGLYIGVYNDQHVYGIGSGVYKDGTPFSSVYSDLKHYLASHEEDTFVDRCPAYTVEAELVPSKKNIRFRNTDGAFDESGEPFAENGKYDVTMLKDPLPVPSKPFYHFLGWYSNDGNWDAQQPQEAYPHISDSILGDYRYGPEYFTYYARWEPITFNVVYEDDDITNPNQTVIYQKDGVYDLLPLAANDYWAFHGWKLNGKLVTQLDPVALWDPSAPYGDEDAYTIVLTADIEYYRHNFDYYVDDALYRRYNVDYKQWQSFTPPSVPKRDHYTGSWSADPSEFKDCRIDAVYEIDKYNVTVQTNLSGYAPGGKDYEYGSTYADIYDELSFPDKYLIGLFYDSGYSEKVNREDLILESGTLYAKFTDGYKIRSAADWSLIQEHGDAYFTLENDINFLGGAIPVVTEFSGVFKGQGHKVTNFINQNNACPITYGLFCTNSGTITDVVFISGIFTATTAQTNKAANVGFITGINKGTIKNVTVEDATVKITCYDCPTLKDTWLDTAENSLYAGVYAGSNQGEIEYCSLTTVKADLNTLMYVVKSDSDTGYMRTWASYGLIAGGNSGTIGHVESFGTLTSTASRSENTSGMFGNHFTYVYFPLRVGGIVGANLVGGKLADSVSNATVTVNHNDSARRSYYGIVDIGGVAGVNNGEIERCYSGADAVVSSYANAETRLGGLVGANDTNAVLRASYSLAQLAPGNRSKTEKTYFGAIAGLNNGAITYCYAVVISVQPQEFANENVYFGGLFGYANNNGSAVNCFVKIDVGGALNSSACGYYDRATVFRCYAYLTENATGFTPCNDMTECGSDEALLIAIANLGFDLMGFELSGEGYPALPNAGNTDN